MKDTQASSTAFTVQQGMIYAGRYSQEKDAIPSNLVSLSEQIMSALPEGKKRIDQLKNPLRRGLLKLMEFTLLPGISLHYVLRKMKIEQLAHQAVDDGVEQIVVLGAGFDMLATQLAIAHSHLTCIEIDHPATSIEKRKAIDNCELGQENCELIAEDLSKHKLEDVLRNSPNFKSQAKTLYICEGVLMYLLEKDVCNILTVIKELSPMGCQFFFTALEPLKSEKNDAGLLLQMHLRSMSEGLNWMLSSDDIEEFLNKNNFLLDGTSNDAVICKELLPSVKPRHLHNGEYVVSAHGSASRA